MKKVEIYSDWWARPNPWAGGYGTIIRFWKKEKELSWFEEHTTNNRMELTWAIKWLEALKEPCEVELFTDSSYVVNWIEKGWAKKWKENNWMRTKSQKATNYDLWEKLLEAVSKHKVHFNWVRWHVWHVENERCDTLATNEILKNKSLFGNVVTGESSEQQVLTGKSSPQPSPEGEGVEQDDLRKIGIVENYWNVPWYVVKLSRELRQKQTSVEKIMWEILRNRKLNNLKFRRQYAFWRYIADFYCFEKNLVIELDWEIHKDRIEYDKIRDEIISKNKVKILRFENSEIDNNIEKVIKEILISCYPSPSGEAGWGLNSGIKNSMWWLTCISQKNIKITSENQPCKKCWTPVVKAIPKKKNTKNKSFYYKFYLHCPSCKTNYFVDEGKVML